MIFFSPRVSFISTVYYDYDYACSPHRCTDFSGHLVAQPEYSIVLDIPECSCVNSWSEKTKQKNFQV